MKVLPFDAHNHIHMGPSSPNVVLEGSGLSGMAIMSTHPSDFSEVASLCVSLPSKAANDLEVIPCFGVHPWWLHELTAEDWRPASCGEAAHAMSEQDCGSGLSDTDVPRWIREIETYTRNTQGAIVGEIGLDGFHFDSSTGELTSSMEDQIRAFELQMELASRLQKPVSIHTVQGFGPLMASLTKLKKSKLGLPPKLYFHAFGGKVGTVDQLTGLCGRQRGKVYFGFAAVINLRSPKTADVVRKVGLDRLVLETDHEDAARVSGSMSQLIEFLAEVFKEPEQRIIDVTTANAFDFYDLTQHE